MVRKGHEGQSVIDLMLANQPITTWSILADDHATGSDHKVMEWEVEAARQEEADHERVVGWHLAEMMEVDVEAAEKLWRELVKENAHLEAECTADKVEHKASWCPEAIGSILDAMGNKIRVCAESTRWWWNADIKERRQAFGREKRRRCNSEEATRAKAELRKSIRQAKSRMSREYLQNLRGAEVWNAARYPNPRAGTTVMA